MTGTAKTLISPLRFPAICSLILFAALGNIFLRGKQAMTNDSQVLSPAQLNRQMKCYKVTEKISEQSYTRLIEWIVIEETELHRFLVISSSSKVYEDSLSSHILSVQDTQTLEDAFRAVSGGSSISREFWENSGSDNIDNSIDKLKGFFSDHLSSEIQHDTAPMMFKEKARSLPALV